MSQHDYVINNDSGASVRADINSALQAILSNNSGTSAPSSTSAGTFWLDTTGGAPYTLKMRDAGNNHWLTIASVTDPGSDGNLAVSAIEGTNVLSTGESGATKFLREDGDGSCSWQTLPNVGQILQVVHMSTESRVSSTADFQTSWDNTPVTLDITPTSASNYILMTAVMNGGNSSSTYAMAFRYYVSGGGTDGVVGVPTGALLGSSAAATSGGPQPNGAHQVTNYSFQTRFRCSDSTPNWSSGALTLMVQWARSSQGTIRLNQSGSNASSINYTNTISTLTAMEIKG